MVPSAVRNANRLPHSYSSRHGGGRRSSSPQKVPTSGVEYWLQSCRAHGLSKGVAVYGLKSINRKTLISYQKSWRKFANWLHKWETGNSKITVNFIANYLIYLFNSETLSGQKFSGEALNAVRSAISFFLKLDLPDLGSHTAITRLFSTFYKLRPSFPRYIVTWDVGKVLNFLAKWHPPSSLSLKQLTLKTVTLIALTSSDRAQTIHAMKVDRFSATPECLEFVIFDIFKMTRRGLLAKVIKCVS